MPNNQFKSLHLLPFFFLATWLLAGCYHKAPVTSEALVPMNERQQDSLSFFSSHHYTYNYNFVVKADSLVLLREQPDKQAETLPPDTFAVHKGEQIVVADIRMIPHDTVDSVWIQVATSTPDFGWIRESHLIPNVVPDDPISRFISLFADVHVLVTLLALTLVAVLLVVRRLMRHTIRMVHFNDLPSFYPTLLALLVATAATYYATLQMYFPEVWRHYYFHPTLNPFSLPWQLALFLTLVWSLPIVLMATVDDVVHRLGVMASIPYLLATFTLLAVLYVVFSVTTLYHVGYVLLACYAVFAVYRYRLTKADTYLCGNCGAVLYAKGRCPHCGVLNE